MKRKQLSACHLGVAKSRIYIVRSTSCISATAARSLWSAVVGAGCGLCGIQQERRKRDIR